MGKLRSNSRNKVDQTQGPLFSPPLLQVAQWFCHLDISVVRDCVTTNGNWQSWRLLGAFENGGIKTESWSAPSQNLEYKIESRISVPWRLWCRAEVVVIAPIAVGPRSTVRGCGVAGVGVVGEALDPEELGRLQEGLQALLVDAHL